VKSALVLGDVRSHTVDLAPDINKTDTRKPYILYGGAFFMRNAIWQALNSLKAWTWRVRLRNGSAFRDIGKAAEGKGRPGCCRQFCSQVRRVTYACIDYH